MSCENDGEGSMDYNTPLPSAPGEQSEETVTPPSVPELKSIETLPYRVQVGSSTDIGGGRENQDDYFVWRSANGEALVLCVLDGHGREVGRLAAFTAKQKLISLLDADAGAGLIASPKQWLVEAHQITHDTIRTTFKSSLEAQGYTVRVHPGGYLTKSRIVPNGNATTDAQVQCVQGGTSCTLVALVNQRLYIANVGDSTALACAARPWLTRCDLEYLVDSATTSFTNTPKGVIETTTLPMIMDPPTFTAATQTAEILAKGGENAEEEYSRALVLTAEHSPESVYEFLRLRAFRQSEVDSSQPAVHMVYDTPGQKKTACEPIFNPSSHSLEPSQRGSYFKNVRREWASLVVTPESARFRDALAFTRSLGDLHLSTYGVTHLPEVHSIDLSSLFTRMASSTSLPSINAPMETSTPAEGAQLLELENGTICILVATDGVWDNWLYSDIVRFVMDRACLLATSSSTDGAQRVAAGLMQRNKLLSTENFGENSDNSTLLVLYISRAECFLQS